jgi:hypothetical protein
MGAKAWFYKGLHLNQGGTDRCPVALAEQEALTTEIHYQRQRSPVLTGLDTSPSIGS